MDTVEPMDPSVVTRPGGGWYLLVTLARKFGEPSDNPTRDGYDTFVLNAERLDGFFWTLVNDFKRLYPTDELEKLDTNVAAIDPNGFTTGTTLQYFSNPGDAADPSNWDVQFSIDAAKDVFTPVVEGSFTDLWTGMLSGTAVVDGQVKLSNQAYIANGMGADDIVLYAFVQPGRARCIVSYTYDPTGPTWGMDNGGSPILEPDRTFEGSYVMDAAVVRFKGCYVMLYTAELPHA